MTQELFIPGEPYYVFPNEHCLQILRMEGVDGVVNIGLNNAVCDQDARIVCESNPTFTCPF